MTRVGQAAFAARPGFSGGGPFGHRVQSSKMNRSDDENDPLPPRRRRLRLRKLALGILLGSLAGIVLSLVVLAVAHREPLPTIGFEQLDAATQRWAANGLSNYDIDLQLTGVNPGTAHVEVRDAKVMAMTLNGHATKPHLWDDWAVPGLLAIIRRDLESCLVPKAAAGESANPPATQPVYPHGTFDAKYGYPAQYHRITPTGADAQWRVTSFVPK